LDTYWKKEKMKTESKMERRYAYKYGRKGVVYMMETGRTDFVIIIVNMVKV
jgi:hypothetical protein